MVDARKRGWVIILIEVDTLKMGWPIILMVVDTRSNWLDEILKGLTQFSVELGFLQLYPF